MALGYGSECSEVYAELFTAAYIEHLKRYSIEAKGLEFQSDNGSEFGGEEKVGGPQRGQFLPAFADEFANKRGVPNHGDAS